MSRIRTVKPEFWISEQIMNCSHSARLLFIGLWNFCDDGGVHPATIRKLKAEVFPGDDVTLIDIEGWMKELIHQKLVVEFTAQYNNESCNFWFVTGWKHQRIDKPYLKYPPYQAQQASATTLRSFDNHSQNVPRMVEEPSTQGVEGKKKGKERSGREEEAAQAPNTPTASPGFVDEREPNPPPLETPKPAKASDAEFEAFWNAYPKRNGGNARNSALAAWNARRKEGYSAAEIIDGAHRYAAWCAATGKLNTEYVKQASTFLGPQKGFAEAWELPVMVKPRNGQRYTPPIHAMTPEVAEFDAILQNLNTTNLRPAIEGEYSHASH